MMKKVTNALRTMIIITAFLGFLCAVPFYIFFVKEQNTVSLFENRNMTTKYHLDGTQYLDYTLQDTLEKVLADQFPKRQNIVKAKKSFDKSVDEVIYSGSVNDLMLTMMGDTNVYQLGTSRYMINGLMEYSEDIESRIMNRISQMNQLAEDYPEIDFYLYRPVQGHETSIFDETNEVTSYGEYYNQLFADHVNFPVSFLEIENVDRYKEMFFSSDHHWNYRGAYQGYVDIMTLLGKEDEILVPQAINTCNGYQFYGTFSNRTANVLDPDEYVMYEIDYDELKLFVNGEEIEDKYQPKYYLSHLDEFNDPFTYHYNESYRGFSEYPVHHYVNENEEGNILVICDSYAAAIENLLSSSYQNSYFINQTVYLSRTHQFLNYDEFIAEHDIDTILFMYTIENYFATDPEWGDIYKNFDVYRTNKE